MIQLPLTSDPCRTFTTVFGDSRYRVTTQWNERSQVWTMDIANGDTDAPIVAGMPIVLGADLLQSFAPSLGTMLAIDMAAAAGNGTDAGPEEIGDRIQIVWLAPGEVP
jgi:hypothetical protein